GPHDVVFRGGLILEAARLTGVDSRRQPAVVCVGIVAPTSSDDAVAEARKLAGLTQVAERERAEAVNVRDQAAERIVAIGLRIAADAEARDAAERVVLV